MIALFFKILKKSIILIKHEPVILIPYLFFNLILTISAQLVDFADHSFLFNGIVQWLVPTLLLQPFIMITSLSIIRKEPINLKTIFSKVKLCMTPFFMVSLYKPVLLLSAVKFVKLVPEEMASLSHEMLIWFTLMILLMICSMIFIFFQAYFLSNDRKSDTLLNQLRASMHVFLQFKWVTIFFVIYFYFLLFLVLSLIMAGLIAPILPTYLWPIILGCINGGIVTVFNVFILRLYLYLKPMSAH